MRKPVKRSGRAESSVVAMQPPVRGLVQTNPPGNSDPLGAEVLENWIPTQRGIRVRGGLQLVADLEDPVTSLFAYRSAGTGILFAATGTDIYNISALNPEATYTAAVEDQTAGVYSTQQIGTAGGTFLYAVNGADLALLFNGTTWTEINGSSSPAITGATTSTFSAVWLYRNRLFFVQKNTLVAWFLPVDSVGGAVADVSLAGVFQRGGSLLFGATWSLDSGDGLDDKCVFVSTEGEVAVYQGGDPSDATDWALVGRYDVAKPLGINGNMQAGGDLLIATVDGIVPLSQVIAKDPAALSLSAVTRPIERLWQAEANTATSPVSLTKWADRGLGVVSLPDSDKVLTVNLQTGAWASQTGWNAACAETYLGNCYIGRPDGTVCAIDETGFDVGLPFTARVCMAFNDFGNPAGYKSARLVRCAFYTPAEVSHRVGVSVDYNPAFPPAPAATAVAVVADVLQWNVDNWNEANWGGPLNAVAPVGSVAKWQTVTGAGFALAPTIQITSGSATKLDIELIRVDFAYESGGAVV